MDRFAKPSPVAPGLDPRVQNDGAATRLSHEDRRGALAPLDARIKPRGDRAGCGPRHDSPPAPARSADDLAALRARLRRLERGGAAAAPRIRPLGAAALDARLPGGGLPLAGLHEIEGERAEWDDGVATGFCLALLVRRLAAPDEAGDEDGAGAGAAAKPVLWAAPRLDLYGPGLAGWGLDPGRLILAETGSEAAVFWALEEGLRSGALAAVVGEAAALERIAGRRLQLAAEAAGLPCFFLRRRRLARRGAVSPSAAATRWRVSPLPPDRGIGLGVPAHERLLRRPRWRVELLRCRGAAPGVFLVEWDDAAGAFALAAPFCDRPLDSPAGAVQAGGESLQRLAG